MPKAKWMHDIDKLDDSQVIWHCLTKIQRRSTDSKLFSRLGDIKDKLIARAVEEEGRK